MYMTAVNGLISIMVQVGWRWGLQSVCAAPAAPPQSESLGGHVLDNVGHSGSLRPHTPTPGSAGTLAANRGRTVWCEWSQRNSTIMSWYCWFIEYTHTHFIDNGSHTHTYRHTHMHKHARTHTHIHTCAQTHMPAGPQHASFAHLVVLANELEDRDLVVFGELVLWRVLCHSLIRNAPDKEGKRVGLFSDDSYQIYVNIAYFRWTIMRHLTCWINVMFDSCWHT